MKIHAPRLYTIEPLEARIAPAADIAAQILSFTLPDIAVPGDTGSVKFKATNVGDEDLEFFGGIHIYMSPDASGDLSDEVVARVQNLDFTLKPGQSRTFTKPFTLPKLTLPTPLLPAGNYFIVVDVDPRGFNDASNANDDDARPFQQVFQFGQVGTRKGVRLDAVDADGTAATFVLAGPGTGELQPAGGLVDLAFAGVDGKTTVTAKATGGDGSVLLNDIGSASAMKGLVMPGVSANGNLTFPGGVLGLQLAQAGSAGAHTFLTIGAGDGTPVKLKFGRVAEMDFNLQRGVASLTLGEWDNTSAAADTITAPFIQKLTTGDKKAGLAGKFEANLVLNGADGASFALGKAIIGGVLQDAQWQVSGVNAGRVGDITARGAIDWGLIVDGKPVDDISITGDFISGIGLSALFFGDIKVSGKLQAPIEATGATIGRKVAIEKLAASEVSGIEVDAPLGGIGIVDLGQWTGGGDLNALFVKTLSTDGLFVPTDGDFSPNLTLAGPNFVNGKSDIPGVRRSLGKTTIAGNLTGGTWNLTAGADTIVAQNIAAAWTLSGGAEAQFLKITAKDEFDGILTGSYFGDLVAGGTFRADVTATSNGYGIGDVKALRIADANLTSMLGGVSTITAAEWIGGTAQVGGIFKLTTTGNAKAGIAGNLQDVDIAITDGHNLTDLIVRGSMLNVDFNGSANSAVIDVVAGNWIGGSFTGKLFGTLLINGVGTAEGRLQNVTFNIGDVGDGRSLDLLTVDGTVSDVTINAQGMIDKFTAGKVANTSITTTAMGKFEIRGLPNSAGPHFDNSLIIASGKIARIIVRDVNGAAPTPNGFQAGSIDSYARFTAGVRTIFIEELDAPGVFDPIGSYKVTLT